MKNLRMILLINALSSGFTGLLLVIDASLIARWFGATELAPFWGTGLFLLGFATFVGLESRKNPIRHNQVRTIIFLDVIWVVASAILIAFQLFGLTQIGYILIGAVAVWVGAMAFLQTKGLQQLRVSNT